MLSAVGVAAALLSGLLSTPSLAHPFDEVRGAPACKVPEPSTTPSPTPGACEPVRAPGPVLPLGLGPAFSAMPNRLELEEDLETMADGIGQPHLADATDLERWADLRTAQADLPRLVRRLVRHENDQVQRVEMRGGEGVGLPGYDGIVEATRATSFVPEGLSVWEMGTNSDPARKATKEYKDRTAEPLGDRHSDDHVRVRDAAPVVQEEGLEQKRRDEGKWRDVRVLDADDIEQALEECAAVRVWLSELLGMPALGVLTS